jgi:hypothetical protein
MCHVVNYPIRSLDEMTTYAHTRESPYRQNTDIVGWWISFPFLHMEICLLGLCLQHGRGNLAVLWLPCPFQCQVDAKWSDIWVVDVDTVRYRLRLAVGSREGGSCVDDKGQGMIWTCGCMYNRMDGRLVFPRV